MRNATLLFTGDALAAGANGAGKSFSATKDLAYVQISIEADAATTSAVKVTLQGRLDSNAAWVTLDKADHATESSAQQATGAAVSVIFPVQLMPQMRVVHSGTYAATTGNDVRVWLLASGDATRSDS